MWRLKSLAIALLVGVVLFGGSTFLVEGQEKKNGNSREFVSSDQDSAYQDNAYQDNSIQDSFDQEESDQGESVVEKEPIQKTLKDLPSPIQGKPLRVAGEYYSEELETMLFHPGTDYAQAEGAVIRVKHPGRVIYAGPDPFLGNKVEVDCGEDWSVVYGGLKNLRVKEGDWVEIDDAIGQIGYYPDLFGDLEQTHLHYEIWHGDLVQTPN